MQFDTGKSIDNKNKKIYLDKIDTNEGILIDKEYIFLDSIKTTKEIVITKKTIILGDIECSFLNVISELICYGNLKANSIFTVLDIQCYKEASYDKLLAGNVNTHSNCESKEIVKYVDKVVEVVKEVEVDPFENIEINKGNIEYPLSIIDEFKDKVIDYADSELIFLDDDEFISELDKIGLTFLEFKNYSSFLKKIKKYSKLDKIRSLNQYLDFLSIIKDTPKWLEEIDIVENTVEKLMIYTFNDLKELELDLLNKDEVLKILADVVYNKNKLNGNYDDLIDYILDKYKNLLIISDEDETDKDKADEDKIDEHTIDEDKTNEHIIDEEKKLDNANANIDVRDLYYEYVWKKGSLLECKVKSINKNYLELLEINKEDNKKISIIMRIKGVNKYSVGEKIFVCISDVGIQEEKLKIEVVNDSNNMSRLLFKYLSSKSRLKECKIQNFSRIKNKSTCIVLALPLYIEYNIKLKMELYNIKSQMRNYLDEVVDIFIYNKDIKKFAANILDIDSLDIKVNKADGICTAKISSCDEKRINDLLKSQKENLSNIFPYTIKVLLK